MGCVRQERRPASSAATARLTMLPSLIDSIREPALLSEAACAFVRCQQVRKHPIRFESDGLRHGVGQLHKIDGRPGLGPSSCGPDANGRSCAVGRRSFAVVATVAGATRSNRLIIVRNLSLRLGWPSFVRAPPTWRRPEPAGRLRARHANQAHRRRRRRNSVGAVHCRRRHRNETNQTHDGCQAPAAFVHDELACPAVAVAPREPQTILALGRAAALGGPRQWGRIRIILLLRPALAASQRNN
jgi:hypothetical protein